MKSRALACATLLSLVPAISSAQGVTSERLLNADAEPWNWLTYSGGYESNRYTTLTQIDPANVGDLQLEWVFQVRSRAGAAEKFEATPLVVDGVMYTVTPPNDLVALDPLSGRVFWTYSHTNSNLSRVCCGNVNRGVGIHGNTLFMGTLDGKLLAIDALSGDLVWEKFIGDPGLGYSVTVSPLVVGDKVIVGPAGGEFGIRGFVAAFDVDTGEEQWRFHTVPGPGEPGFESWEDPAQEAWKTGGGSIWTTGSYDPELNLVYWGVGNPGPDWNGDSRPGDNLYTDSVIALDADNGELAWHYQFTPHDEMDYDATQIPVLADIEFEGEQRKVMLWANRNGLFYVIDRATGEFLLGKPFVEVNWMSGFEADGRPVRALGPSEEGTFIMPNNQGATNWYSPSYSPQTGYMYVPTWLDTYSVYTKRPVTYVPGEQFIGAYPTMAMPALGVNLTNVRLPEEGMGAIQAIDPQTGEIAWRFLMNNVTDSGVLTSASGLVFAGGREGHFYALDAFTGEMLWKQSLGGQIASGPMSFAIDDKQFVAVAAGAGLFVFSLPEE